MKHKLPTVLAVAAGLLLISSPVSAHHGNADYDTAHSFTVKGTVTEFEFINPHAQLHLDAKDEQGKIEKWDIELGSPNSMRRIGWTRNSLKPGDEITVIGNRKKDGSKSMYLEKILLPNGKEVNGRLQQ